MDRTHGNTFERLKIGLDEVTRQLDDPALEQRAQFERGENDDRLRAELDAAIRRSEAVLAAAEREGHAPTIAAAALLHGMRLGDRASVGGGLADAQAAVEVLRRAASAPALGHAQYVAWGLVLVAELRAAESNEAFRAEWEDGMRRYDGDVLLYRACFGPNGSRVLPGLRDEPEVREAITLLKAAPNGHPRVSDWVLARVGGDPELEARARPALARDDTVLSARIDALLRPGHPGPVATLAMLQAAAR